MSEEALHYMRHFSTSQLDASDSEATALHTNQQHVTSNAAVHAGDFRLP